MMPRKSVTPIVLSFVFSAILVGVYLPKFIIRARMTSASNECVNNLKQIEGAKDQWGLVNRKAPNDTPTMEELRPYLGRGPEGSIPVCPHGGIYTFGQLNEPPRCSVDGAAP